MNLDRHIFIAVLSLAATPVFAAATKDIDVPKLQAPVGTGEIANVTFSLFVVIGAILLCGWLYTRTRSLRGQQGDVFRIVATQPLGPKERIVVIEVANKQLVLGMTASQVSTLHVFDEPVVQPPPGRLSRGTDASFAVRLKSILRGEGR